MTNTHYLELPLSRTGWGVPEVFEPLKFDCNWYFDMEIILTINCLTLDNIDSGRWRWCGVEQAVGAKECQEQEQNPK